LKCKTCDFRGRKTSPKCWRLFSQCGNCAYRDHPEAFGNSICKGRIAKRKFGLCKECGERCSRLRATVNAGMKFINGHYCFHCKIMVILDNDIKVTN
jgi:hypothetical protein